MACNNPSCPKCNAATGASPGGVLPSDFPCRAQILAAPPLIRDAAVQKVSAVLPILRQQAAQAARAAASPNRRFGFNVTPAYGASEAAIVKDLQDFIYNYLHAGDLSKSNYPALASCLDQWFRANPIYLSMTSNGVRDENLDSATTYQPAGYTPVGSSPYSQGGPRPTVHHILRSKA